MSETPLVNQYKSIKEKNPDTLLAFRIGDFYEFLYDDAKIASKVLGITLTSKPLYKNHRAPLAGIPAKAAWQYFEKLIKNGHKVAICEQVGEGKKLMEREIVEILTPGTFYHPDFTDEVEHIFIASLAIEGNKATISIADIGTGEIFIENGKVDDCLSTADIYGIKEILVEDEFYYDLKDKFQLPFVKITTLAMTLTSMTQKICQFMNVPTLKIINIEDDPTEVKSVFTLISYLEEIKPGMLTHLRTVKRINTKKRLVIDSKTAKHLELVEKPFGGDEDTLFRHLKETITPQGTRYLKENILIPPSEHTIINRRLAVVEFFIENANIHNFVREKLSKISDLERLISRFSSNKYHIKDFLRFSESIMATLELKETLSKYDLIKIPELSEPLVNLIKKIDSLIEEDPPSIPPGWIKRGSNLELDELKDLRSHATEKLLELEKKEKINTGIPNLRIGYNQVFGYYYEVTKSYLDRVPAYFIRKQTLQNAERFYTQELNELEEKLFTAEEKIVLIEREIIENLRLEVLNFVKEISKISDFIKEIDLLQAFATISKNYNYVKPIINQNKKLLIRDGRHPVVERNLKEPFIANDTYLDPDEAIMYIITGPNMSGKSTYLRQVALIVILAHMGCFVPASYAEIPITDRIFARIGASDDVTKGVSTFMAEMLETAEIMRNATVDSLLILDEIGRGTSTTDGIAIAWACAEFIVKEIKAKTLFATHYHELSEIPKIVPLVKNFHMKVVEWEGNIIFMRKLIEGASNKSYGIHVAALSGLPQKIIERAKEIANQIEKKENELARGIRTGAVQLSLFDHNKKTELCEVCKTLRSIEIDGITLKEALNLLYKLKEDSGKCSIF